MKNVKSFLIVSVLGLLAAINFSQMALADKTNKSTYGIQQLLKISVAIAEGNDGPILPESTDSDEDQEVEDTLYETEVKFVIDEVVEWLPGGNVLWKEYAIGCPLLGYVPEDCIEVESLWEQS